MHHIATYLDKTLLPQLAQFSGKVGVSILSVGGDLAWHYHSDDILPVASCMKLFVLGTLLEQVDRGNCSLDTPLSYTAGDIIGGSGLLLDMQVGTTLTAYNLALLMMVVSDNTATNLLTDFVGGIEVVQDHMRRHGAVDSKINRKMSEDPAVMATCPFAVGTAAEYANYLVALHQGKVLSIEGAALLDFYMERQHYKNFVPGLLPLVEDFDECWASTAQASAPETAQATATTPANRRGDPMWSPADAETTQTLAPTPALQQPLTPVYAACKTGWMTGTRCDVGYLDIAGEQYAYAVLSGDCKDLRPTADNEAVRLLNQCGLALYHAVTQGVAVE